MQRIFTKPRVGGDSGVVKLTDALVPAGGDGSDVPLASPGAEWAPLGYLDWVEWDHWFKGKPLLSHSQLS